MWKRLTFRGKLWTVGSLVAFMYVLSWVAGQCHGKVEPVPAPPPVPGFTDAGAPAAGAVNQAPTDTVNPAIAKPRLSREQLEAEAKEMGLELRPRKKSAPAPRPPAPAAGGEISPPVADVTPADSENPSEDEKVWPDIFARQTFGPGPAGDRLTVWAIQMEEGGRIILTSKWEPFQPPPPPPAPVFEESDFGNRARFHRYLIAGGVATGGGDAETKIEPGIGGGISFESWRYKKATLDAHVAGMVSVTGRFAALGGLGVGW